MKRLLLVVVAVAVVVGDSLPPSCERPVYCDSELLHFVQLAHLYTDSKTFVDLPLRTDENVAITDFNDLLNKTNRNPTKEQIRSFVQEHFDETSQGELTEWTPPDFKENPEFLNKIRDEQLRQYAKDINSIWPTLGRKVKPEVFEKPNQFSLVPVTHGFIIPGGRFKEIYYWDAYWIIEGLIISGMEETARGMIENLIELLEKFGKIPNGSRWYYQERSQPPLLSAMMALYYDKTKDKDFLSKHIESLAKEMNYWLDTQAVTFNKTGRKYTLLRYFAPSAGPRPESYSEDYEDAQTLDSNEDHTDFYIDIKSAAESGWDFSTRWFVSPAGDNSGNLTNIHTRFIIPVDLNSIFANALANTAKFYGILKKPLKAAIWSLKADQWKNNIENVLWHEEDGIWYDYDMHNEKHRKYFYPSNVAPLWRQAVKEGVLKKHTPKVLNYLKVSQGLDFPGGIPASLVRSGEQWDFPNVWPPEVSIVIKGLENMNTAESNQLAFRLAQDWVRICLKGFSENKQMFEKYDAEVPGKFGGGGEYNVQAGFGWSNGVVLEFLERYGEVMTANESDNNQIESAADNKASHFDSMSVVPLVLGGKYMTMSYQLAHLYTDSKTFVDLPLRTDENVAITDFNDLLNKTNRNPTKEQIRSFVQEHFDETSQGELTEWTPPDFKENPEFLNKIRDEQLRQYAKDINSIWPTLGRKVKPEVFEKPNQFSLVPVTHGFIIPGGRFKEIYYWDAYWIIEGLIISGMEETARGMIENLIELLEKFGKIPNGSRWYYQERSQPPLLSAMMALYYDKTKDKDFLSKHIESLAKEMNYWLDTQAVTFNKTGRKYTLLRYFAPSAGPRPESYSEDYEDAQTLDSNEDHTDFYIDIKSAAESGWDFSTRWFVSPAGDNSGNLTNIHTRFIIPVDLNSIFANALANTAKFYGILKKPLKAAIWSLKADQWKNNIENVLWHEEDGIWYDYDMHNEKHRKYFYPSNVAPLWRQAVKEGVLKKHTPKVLNYLKVSQGLDFPGGIPASLVRSGEQWDFPNVWPPEVSIVIKGLENMNTAESNQLAFRLAQDWVRICLKGFSENKQMFEKYDAEVPGKFGGGGEYNVQAGFGWSNGVVLEFLERYGEVMTANESDNNQIESAADNKASHFDSMSVVPLVLGGKYMTMS